MSSLPNEIFTLYSEITSMHHTTPQCSRSIQCTVTAPKREKDPKSVVITGMGLVSVFGNDVDKYYDKLLAGEMYCIETLDASNSPVVIPYLARYSMINSAPALLAIDVGFMGPTYAIATACATSNYCLCAAANHIREGEADLMIAGGVESSFVSVAVGALAARNNKVNKKCLLVDISFRKLLVQLQDGSLRELNVPWAFCTTH
ncbi:3-oxoacyl-[acyl-carrier-protein] synthase I, chloroplastic [Tanacetum coccineum]